MSLLREYIRDLLIESEAMTQDKVQSIVDRVFPQIMDDRGVGKLGAPKVELHGGIYARYSGVEGMEGELSHSSKAEWVDEDNTIYIYHPNMVNEEDVIRSVLHEFEHTHQDPEEYEEYRKQGYDGKTNPHEVDAINAESNWKNYLVDPVGKEPGPLREHIRNLLTEANDTVPPDFDGFMAEYESMTQQNPLNPGQRYWNVGQKDGVDCMVLTQMNEFDDAISVLSIQTVPPDVCQGQGFASSVMNTLMNLADKYQVPASLDPEPFGQEKLGVKELQAWYSRSGFKPDPAYGGEWRRYPK
jgi:hypothetical protein